MKIRVYFAFFLKHFFKIHILTDSILIQNKNEAAVQKRILLFASFIMFMVCMTNLSKHLNKTIYSFIRGSH